uniref:Uncharacterized protein n=1 Tax=Nelumbo nucifera TaxID=4432 RepID=A0A822Y475_NELNU|nr:TPA_asm: hypothetical protein HUJ06_028818 [Nelumbo nucifera]
MLLSQSKTLLRTRMQKNYRLMARLVQVARRIFLFKSSSSCSQALISRLQPNPHPIEKPLCSSVKQVLRTRNYINEMRHSAVDANILRMLRSEIQYEYEYSRPQKPATEVYSFIVEDRPGEQWIRLRGKCEDEGEIKIEATMFDESISVRKSGYDAKGEDVQPHINVIVDISKGEGSDVMEFVCMAWSDYLEIQRVFMLQRDGIPARSYVGRNFKKLSEDLQDALQEFLEARGETSTAVLMQS